MTQPRGGHRLFEIRAKDPRTDAVPAVREYLDLITTLIAGVPCHRCGHRLDQHALMMCDLIGCWCLLFLVPPARQGEPR